MTTQLEFSFITYMEDRGRLVRLRPTTGLPLAERYTQAERIIDATWDLFTELGISAGAKPTLLMTGDAIAPSSTLLARIAHLEIEVRATYHMCGLGAASNAAVHAIVSTPIGKTAPNFRKIVDDTFNDNDE